MRRRILVLSVAVVAVVASACSSGGHHSAAGTTTSTTASAGPNPDVIPSVITPAYVDAVFRVLNHINGNATRSLLASKSMTSSVRADLRAIFAGPLYLKEVQLDQTSIKGSLANVRQPPGDVTTQVVRLIHVTGRCIFVAVTENYGAVLYKPGPPPSSGYWGLQPKVASSDPEHLNPTGWSFFFNAVYKTPTSVPDQCV